MLHEGSMSEYKNFEGDRKLVRHRMFHGNQGLIQSLRSKERSVSTVLMTEFPKCLLVYHLLSTFVSLRFLYSNTVHPLLRKKQ